MKRIVILLVTAMMAMPVFAQNQNRQNTNPSKKSDTKASEVCEAKSKDNCKLNLTDEQKGKIEVLRQAHQKEMKNFRLEMDVLDAELRKLEGAENPSEKDINAKIDQITVLKGKEMKASAKNRIAIRSLLTDEQKQAFDSMPPRNDRGMMPGGQPGGQPGSEMRPQGNSRDCCQDKK